MKKEEIVIGIVVILAILAIFGSIIMFTQMSSEGLKHIDPKVQNPEMTAYQTGWIVLLVIIFGICASGYIGYKAVCG